MQLRKFLPPHYLRWKQQVTHYIRLQSHLHLSENIKLTFGLLHAEDENMTPFHRQVDGFAPLSSPEERCLFGKFCVAVSDHTWVKQRLIICEVKCKEKRNF